MDTLNDIDNSFDDLQDAANRINESLEENDYEGAFDAAQDAEAFATMLMNLIDQMIENDDEDE